MNKENLVRDLKNYLIVNGNFTHFDLEMFSDDEIIEFFTTCDRCKKRWSEGSRLEEAIVFAEDANHFFDLTSSDAMCSSGLCKRRS